MSSSPLYTEWIWSPEHGKFYCYRYNEAGLPEYRWSASNQDENSITQNVADQRYGLLVEVENDAKELHVFWTRRGLSRNIDEYGNTREPRSLPNQASTPSRTESNYSYGSSSGYSADASSTQASISQRTTTQADASSVRSEHSDRSSQFSGRQSVNSPAIGQRHHEGDDVLMPIEERGELIQASFTIRAARLGSYGTWEYQLWHDDGTLYDGGYWFDERDLI